MPVRLKCFLSSAVYIANNAIAFRMKFPCYRRYFFVCLAVRAAQQPNGHRILYIMRSIKCSGYLLVRRATRYEKRSNRFEFEFELDFDFIELRAPYHLSLVQPQNALLSTSFEYNTIFPHS